jgi:hypothetical protein
MSAKMDFDLLLDMRKFSSKPANERQKIIDNFYSLAKQHDPITARAKKLKKCGDKLTKLNEFLILMEDKKLA